MNIWMLTVGYPSTGHRSNRTPFGKIRSMICGRTLAAGTGAISGFSTPGAWPAGAFAFGRIVVMQSVSGLRYWAATRCTSSAVTA